MAVTRERGNDKNIVRYQLFWQRTAELRAKLVLGAPNGNAKHQLGKEIGEGIVSGPDTGLNKIPRLPDGGVPEPDPGFGYSPRERLRGVEQAIQDRRSQCPVLFSAAHLAGKNRHNTPMWCDENKYPGILARSLEGVIQAGGGMPEPRSPTGIERLSKNLSETALFNRFMLEFKDEGERFTDVIGNLLVIDRALFEDNKGKWKIMKGERAQWLLYTAINIKKPDEIWFEPGNSGGADRLYYLSRFDAIKRMVLSCVAVFERPQDSSGAWRGRTNYATTRDDDYIETKRWGGKALKYWRCGK